MGISRHLSRLGATVAPLALLLPFAENEPLGQEHFDLIFKSSQNLILGTRYIMKQKPNLFPVVLNQFLCRQDACVIPFLSKLLAGRPSLRITLDENVGVAGLKTRCTAFWHVMKNQVVFSPDSKTIRDPFYSFVPDRRLKRFDGVVWMIGMLRFYAAGYKAIGINVKFFPEESRDAIDRGRKYFPDGEPCLPFIREAGLLEKLAKNPEFDPGRDLIHVPGTRHCASTTLPHLYKRVFEKLGLSEVKFISPRDGLDTAEAVETFGTTYVQNITRALFGEEYLKKMLLAIRPYEVNRGEADTVFRSCMEQFHSSFGTGSRYFKTLRAIIDRMAAVKTNEKKGSRPKVLITGEYVVRTDPFLNDDIHRKIETLGGEAIRTPLFADYVELAGRRRYRSLWKLEQRSKALREFVLTRFLLRDIHKIRAAFAPHIPDQIEPNPVDSLKDCSHYMNHRLDPVMLLEFYQAFWNMKRGDIAGIVNVHPFGCSISTAVEPMLHKVYGKQVPVLSLSFDGQANVHMNNRLGAFMECVHDRS
jgi:predicted nucleotide-binding protein (sugar kinase/HSP70/actin superfamily)